MKRIFFFDESRFGTHSKIGHGWYKTGSRTRVDVKLGFQNFYVYSAVEPSNGGNFSLILPYVNTHCMNLFLSQLSNELSGEDAIVIVDGAGWHKSKDLIVPKNIELVYLPPYSPELNPVERLWLYIKKAILYNKIYENLEDLEDSVCDFLNKIDCHTISSICSIAYMLS